MTLKHTALRGIRQSGNQVLLVTIGDLWLHVITKQSSVIVFHYHRVQYLECSIKNIALSLANLHVDMDFPILAVKVYG